MIAVAFMLHCSASTHVCSNVPQRNPPSNALLSLSPPPRIAKCNTSFLNPITSRELKSWLLGGSEDFRQAAVVPSGGRLSPLEADDFLVLEGEEDGSSGGDRGVRLGGGGHG